MRVELHVAQLIVLFNAFKVDFPQRIYIYIYIYILYFFIKPSKYSYFAQKKNKSSKLSVKWYLCVEMRMRVNQKWHTTEREGRL